VTHRQLWGVWWTGSTLIILSWVHVVPNWIGWVGFFASAFSTLMSVIQARYWRRPPPPPAGTGGSGPSPSP
jgi:hypothetical protein